MLFSADDLLRCKGEIDEVFSQCAGQRFLKNSEKFLCFGLIHQSEGWAEFGENFASAVDAAAADFCDVGLLWPEPAANFSDFLFVHL